MKPIDQAIKLARDAIEEQENRQALLVGWYVYAHERHAITLSVGVETDVMHYFTVPVQIDLNTGKAKLV